MLAFGKDRDAVIDEAGGAAPYDDVAAFQSDASLPIASAKTAPQKSCRQSERNRYHRRGQVALVLVAVQ